MRIVYAGTPAFAVPTLEALVDAGHALAAVYTQPDRAAGRGRRIAPSPVKAAALARRLVVHQPPTLRAAADAIAALRPDALVVVAYGSIVPPPILAVPRYGGVNVHASLLPRWRGAAPIARAIEAGDDATGITIMQMDAGLDTGPILAQERVAIGANDTTAQMEERLALLGARLLVATLVRLESGDVAPQPQDAARASYAPKLQKREALIDWRQPAPVLHRKIRAFNPRPVAHTTLAGEVVRLWEVGRAYASAAAPPGAVLRADATGIHVATGDGALVLTCLQASGGRRLAARDFLNGRRIASGDRFGT